MKAGRLWLFVYGAGFLVCFAFLLMTLFTPVPYGDVTRVGRISEVEFRPHRAAPVIEDANVFASPVSMADVLVIGDSFSIRFAWQAALVKAGYKVVTTHWDKTGPLCSDLGGWLQRSGFHGKFVIVESIERLLPERLDESAACAAMPHPFEAVPHYLPLTAETAPRTWLDLNWNADWVSGWLTYSHTRAIKASHDDLVFDHPRWGDLIVARNLPEGCAQFSNRLCHKGLFLVDDDRNPPLTAQSVASMQRIAASAKPFRLLWMVIPNKTTVYVKPRHATDFLQRLGDSGVGPDLFTFAVSAKSNVVDLYAPNDTHLSLQGYLAFGEQMLQAVKKADR